MFLHWNAERLNISVEESQERYFASWAAIRNGHTGAEYRVFNELSYKLFQVFFSDAASEIYDAYQLHALTHFLRMLSYPEPKWKDSDIIVQKLSAHPKVDILDYGCGLAQKSRTLAEYLVEKGVTVGLFLVDIPTIRKEFLLWLGRKAGITTAFTDCMANKPIPKLPRCDICFAVEFFEHVYDPLRYFDQIHAAIRMDGILVTNVENHKEEFMHVSPNLEVVRDKIQMLGYKVLTPDRVFEKKKTLI